MRFRFDDRDSAGLQRYTLTRLEGADAADPHAPGAFHDAFVKRHVTHSAAGELSRSRCRGEQALRVSQDARIPASTGAATIVAKSDVADQISSKVAQQPG